MQFDAIAEDIPGDQWLSRWNRSWPAYRQWFLALKGDQGPSRKECEAALSTHMPKLVPIWNELSKLSGDDDMAARFLFTWCPPAYLAGCSLAALSKNGETRLVRNYDLSPELNEGLLMRTQWAGTPVMGMVEFLWGLSDGVNQHGLAIALAFGGSKQCGVGFGITTILRYVMQTCEDVDQALSVLCRVPSHMAYNVTVADKSGRNAAVALKAGGGASVLEESIATNHQEGSAAPDRAAFTKTFERLDHLKTVVNSYIEPAAIIDEFLKPPLYQYQYAESMGTLFTADYDPAARSLDLHWPDARWSQSLDNFTPRTAQISFKSAHNASYSQPIPNYASECQWLDHLQCMEQHVSKKENFQAWMRAARAGDVNWTHFPTLFDSDYR